MPLPGSKRNVKPQPLQEIVNDGQEELLQEIKFPTHESMHGSTTLTEEKPKRRSRRSKKK